MNLDWFWTFFWSIMPISELRGGIPFGLAKELNPFLVYLVCVGTNALAFPIVYVFLEKFHPFFIKWNWYKKLFDKLILRTRRKLEQQIEKYGFWSLLLFVMIPLPVTGAYTGSLAAWLFNIEKKKAFLAVLLGVMISGIIVTSVYFSGVKALDFLIKDV